MMSNLTAYMARLDSEAVSIRSAPNNTPLHFRSDRAELFKDLEAKVLLSSAYSGTDKLLLYVMFLSGCRVSEALDIRPSRISPSGQVLLRGLKGSEDRVINIGSMARYGVDNIILASYDIELRSRFSMYRLLKRLGFSQYFGESSVPSVTHIFRHMFVREQAEQGIELTTTQRAVGHKNINNTKHYANGQRRRSGRDKGNTL